jgi:hypothetical protein
MTGRELSQAQGDPLAWDNISNEEFRVYYYSNGAQARIPSPSHICITPNGSHIIKSANGMTYRPTPGYILIGSKPRADPPALIG